VVSPEEAAGIMLNLQQRGCHNINLVTPTHFTPQLIEAIYLAAEEGLSLPVVWNCGGYESVPVLKLLKGIVDIYMPDMKYSRGETARLLSSAEDYVERCKESLREMHRQVGDLLVVNGLARRGLLIRHLVLPGHVEESLEILEFIAQEISPHSYVNVMAQYRPCGRVPASLSRPVSLSEYEQVISRAASLGLVRGLR